MRGTYKHQKYTREQIEEMRMRLLNREISVADLLKEQEIGYTRLKREFAQAGVPFPKLKVGKRPKAILNEEIDAVLEYRKKFTVGYQRCSFALKRKGLTTLSARKCNSIFKTNSLYIFERKTEEKEEKERTRYVAKMVGQIWHTDLHQIEDLSLVDENGNQIHNKQYIVAFLDDRSRFIIHASIVLCKESSVIAEELEKALKKASPPIRMIIDNGGEFVGTPFQAMLEKYGVKDWRTQPYNPEQNGKMERWWQTYEGSKGKATLQEVINEYNYSWRHGGLHELTGRWMTPSDMWLTEAHWTPGCPDEVIFGDESYAK